MRVAVIGASLAGLFAAAATAARGAETTILERDRLPDSPGATQGRPAGPAGARPAAPRPAQRLGPAARAARGPDRARRLGLRRRRRCRGSASTAGCPPGCPPTSWSRSPGRCSSTWSAAGSWPCPACGSSRTSAPPHCAGRRRRPGGRPPWNPENRRLAVEAEDGDPIDADVVIDASGRSSRMPHWLAELGVSAPEPEVVDAHLGYACRLYRATGPAAADHRCGDRRNAGQRPRRDRAAGGGRRLAGHRRRVREASARAGTRRSSRPTSPTLPDPAIADVVDRLEPVSDVAVYRQTSNRRHRYGLVRSWPAGCWWSATPPAPSTRSTGRASPSPPSRPCGCATHWGRPDLQRRLDRVADFCWSVATSEDLRQPTSDGSQNLAQRLASAWSMRAGPAGGDRGRAGVPDLRPGVPPDDRAAGAVRTRRWSAEVAGARVRGHRPAGAAAGGAGPAPLARSPLNGRCRPRVACHAHPGRRR